MPLSLYKNPGETPLEALNRLRTEKPELAKETLSYAGRLDPLAEGEMLVLVGEENKERQKWLNRDKVYEVDILFGFGTDTGDPLGLVTESKEIPLDIKDQIEATLPSFVGKRMQNYPAYSSKTIDGVPMHQLARKGEIGDEEIPTKEIEIYNIRPLGFNTLDKEELLNRVMSKINSVKGDFRQEEIKAKWEEILAAENEDSIYPIYTLQINCSSGTYMRVLAAEIGKSLHLPALAFHIKRTMVY